MRSNVYQAQIDRLRNQARNIERALHIIPLIDYLGAQVDEANIQYDDAGSMELEIVDLEGLVDTSDLAEAARTLTGLLLDMASVADPAAKEIIYAAKFRAASWGTGITITIS